GGAGAVGGGGLWLGVLSVDGGGAAPPPAPAPLPPPPGAGAPPPGPAAGPHPPVLALVSSGGRNVLGNGSSLNVAGRTIRLRLAGRLNAFPGMTTNGQFAVVPQWALGHQAPPATVMVIVGPRLGTAALLPSPPPA